MTIGKHIVLIDKEADRALLSLVALDFVVLVHGGDATFSTSPVRGGGNWR